VDSIPIYILPSLSHILAPLTHQYIVFYKPAAVSVS